VPGPSTLGKSGNQVNGGERSKIATTKTLYCYVDEKLCFVSSYYYKFVCTLLSTMRRNQGFMQLCLRNSVLDIVFKKTNLAGVKLCSLCISAKEHLLF